jgi:hypothetical protein
MNILARALGVLGLVMLLDGAAMAGVPTPVLSAIIEDEATVAFVSANKKVSEAATVVELRVARQGDIDDTLSVSFATADSGASAGADYTAASGTLLWNAGDASVKIIYVPILQDSGGEAAESFTVTLANPTNAMLGSTHVATVTIYDDESSPFGDIAGTWALGYIRAIFGASITQGCDTGLFCPTNRVTRDQMAVFIIRALEGDPAPGYCSSPPFSDVPINHWACGHIKRLKELGITTGFPDGSYHPGDYVTRVQMAAFLVRAIEGEPDADACAGISNFQDVSASNPMCGYIKRLALLSITTGCGSGNYCPDDEVTREQMATFLARSFLGMSTPVDGICGSNMTAYVGQIRTDTDTWPGIYCSQGEASGLTANHTPSIDGDAYRWQCTGNNLGGANNVAQCAVNRGYFVNTAVDPTGLTSVGGVEAGKVVKHGTAGSFAISVATGFQAVVTPSSIACGNSQTFLATGSYTSAAILATGCGLSVKFSEAPNNDPGIGTGTWLPPGTSSWFVVDQTGVGGLGIVNYTPGCVNNQPAPYNSSTGCALSTSYYTYFNGIPYVVAHGYGRTVTTRFRAKTTSPGYDGDIQLDGPTGDNITDTAKLWLTTVPTQSYETTDANCRATSNAHASIYTTLRGTPGRCQLVPGQRLYLHLRIDGGCVNCRYKYYESTDIQ